MKSKGVGNHGNRGPAHVLASLAVALVFSVNGAYAQLSLAGVLKQTLGDVANLRNSSVQFLQGGGRWFPTPQGNDLDLANNLRDLHDRADTFLRDVLGRETNDTLKFDMDQVSESAQNIAVLLPKVGGNAETFSDWRAVQNDVVRVQQAFQALVAGGQGNTGTGEHVPTVPELTQQLGAETQAFKANLGTFLNAPARVPPPHDEDLLLVQTLKQLERQLSDLSQMIGNSRPLPFVKEQVGQLRYTARKMDPYMAAIGADENTAQAWQQLRETVDQLHVTIGNGPVSNDSAYQESSPPGAALHTDQPGAGMAGQPGPSLQSSPGAGPGF